MKRSSYIYYHDGSFYLKFSHENIMVYSVKVIWYVKYLIDNIYELNKVFNR